jgi:hypothetical protein
VLDSALQLGPPDHARSLVHLDGDDRAASLVQRDGTGEQRFTQSLQVAGFRFPVGHGLIEEATVVGLRSGNLCAGARRLGEAPAEELRTESPASVARAHPRSQPCRVRHNCPRVARQQPCPSDLGTMPSETDLVQARNAVGSSSRQGPFPDLSRLAGCHYEFGVAPLSIGEGGAMIRLECEPVPRVPPLPPPRQMLPVHCRVAASRAAKWRDGSA